MRQVGVEERRARLALRHGLAQPFHDVPEAARAMVGLHSSDPSTVFLSAWARTRDMSPSDLERVLYEERSLVRILGMRRTMWVVPRDTAPLINSSSTAALVEPQRRRVAQMIETSGIAEDGSTWLQEVCDKTEQAIASRGEALATELTEDVPELGEKIKFYKKDGTLMGTFGMSTRILFQLATEARVIRARPTGTWLSSQYRWSTMENWLGEALETIDRAGAQRQLLEMWLLTFGPGTETDMKWWTGWPVTQVRKALDAIGAVEVDLGETTGYLHPEDTDEVAAAAGWVALLPSLDPTTMGWKEREWYLGAHGDQLFDRNGNAGPTIWVDGRVVGGWAQDDEGKVVHELFEDVGGDTADAIGDRIADLQHWLGDTNVTARFRSPHDKAISSS